MKILFLGSLVALSITGQAMAQNPSQCEANYKQGGNFMTGRNFSTSGDVATAPDKAFKMIYQAVVKAGLVVINADKEAGVLSLVQKNAGEALTSDNPADLPWSVVVEANGTGSRISVSKQTPPSYPTSKDFEIKSMCSIITTAAGK